jgi:tripartite ATP-independent transporter DctM subunit
MKFRKHMSVTPHPLQAGLAMQAPSSGVARFGRTLEEIIKWGTEVPAAVLVVAEVLILLANVTYRYALDNPISWGDELASLLFIWLAMLGSVIALQRGEHMRLTTFVAKLSPGWQRWTETFAGVVVTTFMVLLLQPSWEYAIEEWAITTPALEIPHTFRVSAIGVGITLMMVISIARLFARATLKDFVSSAAVVGTVAAALWLSKGALLDLGSYNLLIFFLLGVSVMVVLGVPIMTAFGLSTVAYLLSATNTTSFVVVGRLDEGMSSAILLAVPLFVFLGALIEAMGMAEAMIRFLASLIGHLRGGLSYVLVGAIYLVSGISGSKTADMAAVAPALFPEMKKRGEDDGELVAMLTASGAMSETIPPSLVLITIGSVTGVSIASLFTGGFMPAIVGAIAMSAVIWWKNRNRKMAARQRSSTREITVAFLYALPAIALPFLIRGAVVEGVATATEVATIGVVYSFIIGLAVYRRFEWRRLFPMLVESAALSGAILIIIGCATSMAWALTQSGFSDQLAQLMTKVPGGSLGFTLISALAFIVLGSFLEGIPSIVLFGPLLFPLARAAGVHEVQYAMVVVFAMGLGLFSPPFGVGFYAACAISKVDPSAAMHRVWPYLAALAVALLVIAAVPWLSVGFL